MGFEADEEILQDFLVEAGEILEQLSEQLIELEQRPEDRDLLNAIFRGFHTVKGGAGFLQLTALVDCCHVAENVFDTLRNGQREVDADLMDTVLKALDTVNEMFTDVSNGQAPQPADPALIESLHQYTKPQQSGESIGVAEEPAVTQPSAEQGESQPQAGDDITDSEFESLLDALNPDKGSTPSNEPTPKAAEEVEKGKIEDQTQLSAGSDDEISDDEFEALLDELHGKGRFNPETYGSDAPKPSIPDTESPAAEAKSPEAASSSDEISDDEFEALLDQLHGKGKFNAGASVASGSSEPAKADSPKADPPKAEPAPQPQASQPIPPAEKPPTAAPKAVAAVAERPAANANQDTTVRVDTKRLDDIMNMVGELVLVRNRLMRLGDELEDETLQKTVANLNVVTADLQSSVMKTRMQPIKKVFGRFPRVVRDLARSLKKEVTLELIGEETDLDKNLVDALADPLVHLVRNSVDHGVEAPDVREKAGKPRMGTVTLSAEQEGDHILLMIRDDGGGMNPDVLRGIAVKRGVMDQEAADRLSDTECYNLIFAPGFSTKTEISDVSGRGVGMDVVKTKISQLNGAIEIDSEQGVGTTIKIKVPLTLAIMPTLMVMLADQAFALPLVNVNEIFNLDLNRTNVVDGKEVVMVRGKPLPLYYLKRWLIRGNDDTKSGHVVVVTVGTSKVGFVVDQLIGQEEVVIKPLGQLLNGTDGMSGATITGDGKIALILDVPTLLKAYAG
ncbi:MAG: chemotaxis protein CheA [Saccharospirillum sp.]|nr:chemotaxis protein CheA [Saccharospirillum sp.]